MFLSQIKVFRDRIDEAAHAADKNDTVVLIGIARDIIDALKLTDSSITINRSAGMSATELEHSLLCEAAMQLMGDEALNPRTSWRKRAAIQALSTIDRLLLVR